MRTEIRGGQVVDPASGLDRVASVFVADGRIAAIRDAPGGFRADRVIDATGLVVAPGLVDLAARLREPGLEHKATLDSEIRAAVAGGVTSLACPPDTDPPLDEPGLVEMLTQRARLLHLAHVHPVGALTQRLDGAELAELGLPGCGESMATDGVHRRSIDVTHRNLRTLYFRAYPIDLENRIRTARDYNLLLNHDEQQTLIKTRSPLFEWNPALPAPPDSESHHTFITPPFKDPGCFLIAASARPDFSQSEPNRITTTFLIISDIVMLSTQEDESSVSVGILSGETGRPVPGAMVGLYKYDWQSGHSKVEERVTDGDGRVRFS